MDNRTLCRGMIVLLGAACIIQGMILGILFALLVVTVEDQTNLSSEMRALNTAHEEEIFRLRDYYLEISRWNYYRGWYDYCRLYSDTENFAADCLERADIGAEADMFSQTSTGFDFPFQP